MKDAGLFSEEWMISLRFILLLLDSFLTGKRSGTRHSAATLISSRKLLGDGKGMSSGGRQSSVKKM